MRLDPEVEGELEAIDARSPASVDPIRRSTAGPGFPRGGVGAEAGFEADPRQIGPRTALMRVRRQASLPRLPRCLGG